MLVDSSVWIDHFNGHHTPATRLLHEALGNVPIAVGDLICTEVLQGFRSDSAFMRARELLRRFDRPDLLGSEQAEHAAGLYRSLRQRGVTVRRTADVIIGAWCIRHDVPLLFSDRDFEPMVDHLGLRNALGEAS